PVALGALTDMPSYVSSYTRRPLLTTRSPYAALFRSSHRRPGYGSATDPHRPDLEGDVIRDGLPRLDPDPVRADAAGHRGLPAGAKLEPLWERPRNQLIYALVLGVPVAIGLLLASHHELVAHALIEYVQFIVLLLALFTVSGGIVLRGDLAATPRINTAFLAVGGLLASFIGTTGAAMLLIRPILATNAERRYRAPTVVFAILVVAISGGLLSPLGDPPLFLGMLRGVPFTWSFGLLPMWLFVNALLLLSYWALDRRFHAREKPEALALDSDN